jgi:tetratricopeptide (TPR) repeat protein
MTFKYLIPGALIRRPIILVSALVILSTAGFAGTFEFTPGCDKAWQSIMLFRFTEAQSLLDKEKTANPGNVMPWYIENYIDFLVLFTGEDKAWFEEARQRRDERIDKLEKGDRSSPYYRFCLAELNIQWAFARLKFKEYTAAGLELRKANELLKENQALHPGFYPNRLGLGLMHSLTGVIPENYKWLAGLIGLDGDLEQGMNELAIVARYNGSEPFSRSVKVPACIFSALINATLKNDKEAALGMIGRFDSDPDLKPFADSPLVIYAKASVCLKTGNNGKALSALAGRYDPKATYHLFFLDYLHGVALMNDLDPDASVSFRTFLKGFTGSNYVKSAWQKLAWASLIAGDTLSYRNNIRMALNTGSRDVDEDKQAWFEAGSGQIPNVPLLKARLLFDGGYYVRALDLLLNQSLHQYIRDKKDLAEYYYRLGRIYQSTGQESRAVQNYLLAVQQGKGLPQYFAAGAALQMGLIHEHNRHFTRADSCFRLCLSIDYKEYRTSLSQKAKAGLARIRKELP